MSPLLSRNLARITLIAATAVSGCTIFEPGSPAFPEGAIRPGNPERGRLLAAQNCGGCHAQGKEGDSPYPPAPPFRTLHERYDPEALAEAMAEGLTVAHQGQKQMPEFVLEPEAIDDMIAYLKSFAPEKP
ncbi:MAG: cytochrome c [Alphaproteobacteria bacterium]|nr:cytochrome c [Alphaproteobacteria bacterium]